MPSGTPIKFIQDIEQILQVDKQKDGDGIVKVITAWEIDVEESKTQPNGASQGQQASSSQFIPTPAQRTMSNMQAPDRFPSISLQSEVNSMANIGSRAIGSGNMLSDQGRTERPQLGNTRSVSQMPRRDIPGRAYDEEPRDRGLNIELPHPSILELDTEHQSNSQKQIGQLDAPLSEKESNTAGKKERVENQDRGFCSSRVSCQSSESISMKEEYFKR